MAELEQRSPEWFAARCGKVTASRIWDILKTIRNGNYSAARRNYCAQLVTERLTGESKESPYTNEYMEWGKEQEPVARAEYTKLTGNEIVEVGIINHPDLSYAAASPDGLVGSDGLVEIKCFIPANHLDILLTDTVKEQYRLQMLWQIACTKRKWCDFVSYDPSQREDMRLFIKRFEFTPEEIKDLEDEVRYFLGEVAEAVDKLERKFGQKEQTRA